MLQTRNVARIDKTRFIDDFEVALIQLLGDHCKTHKRFSNLMLILMSRAKKVWPSCAWIYSEFVMFSLD
jgi:hypothetical protein